MGNASFVLNNSNQNWLSMDKQIIIKAPGSKSEAIRAIIGAFLSKGLSHIRNVSLCDDVLRTIYAIEAMDAIVKIIDKGNYVDLEIQGVGFTKKKQDSVSFSIGSSATLFRIIAPIALMKYKMVTIYANEDFWLRPIDEYYKLMHYEGFKDYCILSEFDINKSMEVDGSISSQYASGLLFAQCLLEEDTNLYVLNLESKEYLNMTVDILRKAGFEINVLANRYSINKEKNKSFKAIDIDINGDYSQASYFLTLGAFCHDLEVTNLTSTSQADEVILSLLQSMGCGLERTVSGIRAKKSVLHITQIDVSECIDLAPIIFVIASSINETVKINGTRRLKYKESKRAESLQEEFKKIGIDIEIGKNSCTIYKHNNLNKNCILDSHNDHRICMALVIMCIINKIDCEIKGIESVKKSFPSFFNCLKEIGIEFNNTL